jgi:hypothetical protein
VQYTNAALCALRSNETNGAVFITAIITAVNATADARYAEPTDGPLPGGWLRCD